jgi:hypothetical protein
MMTRDEFMEFFRSDAYSELLSPDDKVEVIVGALQGDGDVVNKVFQKVLDEYSIDAEVRVFPRGEIQRYYIAGSEAINTYYEHMGVESLDFSDPSFGTVFRVNLVTDYNPAGKVLEAIDGWFDWVEITETEYNEILKRNPELMS